jgi:hypothetical protein
MFQSFWITISVISGMCFFREYQIFRQTANAILFPLGLIITIVGVFFLSQQRSSEHPTTTSGVHDSSTLTDSEHSHATLHQQQQHATQQIQHRLTRDPSSAAEDETEQRLLSHQQQQDVQMFQPIATASALTSQGQQSLLQSPLLNSVDVAKLKSSDTNLVLNADNQQPRTNGIMNQMHQQNGHQLRSSGGSNSDSSDTTSTDSDLDSPSINAMLALQSTSPHEQQPHPFFARKASSTHHASLLQQENADALGTPTARLVANAVRRFKDVIVGRKASNASTISNTFAYQSQTHSPQHRTNAQTTTIMQQHTGGSISSAHEGEYTQLSTPISDGNILNHKSTTAPNTSRLHDSNTTSAAAANAQTIAPLDVRIQIANDKDSSSFMNASSSQTTGLSPHNVQVIVQPSLQLQQQQQQRSIQPQQVHRPHHHAKKHRKQSQHQLFDCESGATTVRRAEVDTNSMLMLTPLALAATYAHLYDDPNNNNNGTDQRPQELRLNDSSSPHQSKANPSSTQQSFTNALAKRVDDSASYIASLLPKRQQNYKQNDERLLPQNHRDSSSSSSPHFAQTAAEGAELTSFTRSVPLTQSQTVPVSPLAFAQQSPQTAPLTAESLRTNQFSPIASNQQSNHRHQPYSQSPLFSSFDQSPNQSKDASNKLSPHNTSTSTNVTSTPQQADQQQQQSTMHVRRSSRTISQQQQHI